MKDFILLAILIVIIAAVIAYIYRAKKRGAKCIGCPHTGQCSGNCGGSCGHGCTNTVKCNRVNEYGKKTSTTI